MLDEMLDRLDVGWRKIVLDKHLLLSKFLFQQLQSQKKREKKASRPRKVYKRNRKKERLRKLRMIGITKKIGTITIRWISWICLKKVHVHGMYYDYSKRDVKAMAYSSLAAALETIASSIKTKLNGLRAQLGWEKAKESKSKSGHCTDELY